MDHILGATAPDLTAGGAGTLAFYPTGEGARDAG